jgi:electron transfer flavoprotein beta subunit
VSKTKSQKGSERGSKVNVLVCLKQVPDTETQIKIAPDGKSIVTDNIKWVMNPYDEYAVEEALRLKEKFGGEVTIIAVGPKRVTESIKTALAMGADRGILVDDPSAAGSDSLGTATILEAVIRDLTYDIILCGKQGVDDDCGLVGSSLAELLGIPQISVVIKLEVSEDGSAIRAHREVDGGTLVIESPLPVLITAQKGLNEPRYASLPGIMKAKKKPLDIKTLADLGLDASEVGQDAAKVKITQITPPEERKAAKIVEGETPQEKAANLARLLHQEAKII